MLGELIRTAAPLAADPAGTGWGTAGLRGWIQDNVITLIILAIAAGILWAARGGNVAKGITIGAGAVVGIVFLGLASGNNATDLADFAVGLFRG